MKKFKKIGILLFFIILLGFAIISNAATSITSGNYIYTELSDGTINLTGYNGNEENVVIPSTIDGKKVKKIDTHTFKENSIVKTVTLPEGLEIIDSYVFVACPNLTDVYMPSTLKSLSNLFYKTCPNIKYTIPSNLTKMSNGSYMEICSVTITGTHNYDLINEIFSLVNEERVKEGREPLQYNLELQSAANQRAAEIAIDFDHKRPNSLGCFSISQLVDGENIAAGSTTAKGIMNAWMNSPGHKSNILKTSFNSIAIGCYQTHGSMFWVQLFSEDSGVDATNKTGKEKDVQSTVDIYTGKAVDLIVSWEDINIEKTNKMDLAIGETEAIFMVNIINPNRTTFSALINPSNIKWTSSNKDVFTVDENGTVTAVGVGTAILTATLGTWNESYEITVSDNATSFSLDYNIYQINSLDEKPKLTATTDTGSKANVTWSSDNEEIAKVDSNGTIIPVKGGFTHIRAKNDKLGERSCWVYVCTLINLSNGSQIYAGDLNRDGAITATDASMILDYYRNGENDPDFVIAGDIDGDGKITSFDASIILDIYKNNTFHAGAYIPIKNITLNKTDLKLEVGETTSLISTITPQKTTDSSEITWISSNEKVAIVDNNGKVTLVSKGRAVITATTSNGKKATCTIAHPEFENIIFTTIPTEEVLSKEVMTFNAKTNFNTILIAEKFPILDINYKVKLYNQSNVLKENDEKIGSKDVIKIEDSSGNIVEEYTMIVPGDVTGNGYARMYDAFQILKDTIIPGVTLDAIDEKIRDYNDDGNVRMYDAFQFLKDSILG